MTVRIRQDRNLSQHSPIYHQLRKCPKGSLTAWSYFSQKELKMTLVRVKLTENYPAHQVVTASFAVFSLVLWATVFSSANKEPYNWPWIMHNKLVFHIFSTPLSLILGEKVLNRPESSLHSALWPAFTDVACFKGQRVQKTTVVTAWSRTLELSCGLIYLLF